MNEYQLQQLLAELVDAQEKSLAILAASVGEVLGSADLAVVLERRLKTAQLVQRHPMRDRLLNAALKELRGS